MLEALLYIISQSDILDYQLTFADGLIVGLGLGFVIAAMVGNYLEGFPGARAR